MSKFEISQRQFIDAFLAAWSDVNQGETRIELQRLYENDARGWTAIMCGRSPALLQERSLVERAFEKLSTSLRVHFDPERHKVDAFGRVYLGVVDKDHSYGVNVVMLEVENETRRAYEEFWKLVQSRALLKVLITYQLPMSTPLKIALARMKEIYAHHREVLGADDRSRYLLVLGTREIGPEIRWEFFGLDESGMFSRLIDKSQ